MVRLLTLALFLAFGSLQVQAVLIDMGKDTDPLPPLKFVITKGQLIVVSYRDSKTPTSTDSLLLQVTMERKDGSEKETFSLLIPPVGTQKIGMAQGWLPQVGDKVHLAAPGYRTVVLGN